LDKKIFDSFPTAENLVWAIASLPLATTPQRYCKVSRYLYYLVNAVVFVSDLWFFV